MTESRWRGSQRNEQDSTRLTVAENDIAYLKMRLNNIEEKLDRLLAFFNNAKGAWWVVIILAIVISSVAGFALAVWDKVFK